MTISVGRPNGFENGFSNEPSASQKIQFGHQKSLKTEPIRPIKQEAKQNALRLTIGNIAYGFGKQLLKGNFAFLGAFETYQRHLTEMKRAFREVGFSKNSDANPLSTEKELTPKQLKNFVVALRQGAESIQKVVLSLGAEKDWVSLESGIQLLMEEFRVPVDKKHLKAILMQVEGEAERPLYVEGLAILKQRALEDSAFVSQFSRGTDGINNVFALLNQAAMPSLSLGKAVEKLKKVEALF